MLVAFAVFLGLSASGQIISNGSFEDGNYSGPIDILFAGEGMPGWMVGDGAIEWFHSNGLSSHGIASVDLNAGGPGGSIFQDVTTVAGVFYRVTFDLSGEPISPPSLKTMTVTSDDASTVDYEYAVSETNNQMPWLSQTYFFVANGSMTRLKFVSTISGNFGPIIDNVVASAIGGMVCHANNGSGPFKTMILNESAFTVHMNHGDQIGACQ
jgi:choice-of-anchor C domain-containing protein